MVPIRDALEIRRLISRPRRRRLRAPVRTAHAGRVPAGRHLDDPHARPARRWRRPVRLAVAISRCSTPAPRPAEPGPFRAACRTPARTARHAGPPRLEGAEDPAAVVVGDDERQVGAGLVRADHQPGQVVQQGQVAEVGERRPGGGGAHPIDGQGDPDRRGDGAVDPGHAAVGHHPDTVAGRGELADVPRHLRRAEHQRAAGGQRPGQCGRQGGGRRDVRVVERPWRWPPSRLVGRPPASASRHRPARRRRPAQARRCGPGRPDRRPAPAPRPGRPRRRVRRAAPTPARNRVGRPSTTTRSGSCAVDERRRRRAVGSRRPARPLPASAAAPRTRPAARPWPPRRRPGGSGRRRTAPARRVPAQPPAWPPCRPPVRSRGRTSRASRQPRSAPRSRRRRRRAAAARRAERSAAPAPALTGHPGAAASARHDHRPPARLLARPVRTRTPNSWKNRSAGPNIRVWSTVWFAPTSRSRAAGPRSARSSGTPPWWASSTAGCRLATAVPDVVTTDGRPTAPLARPSARKPAVRSSIRTCSRSRPAASAAASAMDSGALREPGASTTSVTPPAYQLV